MPREAPASSAWTASFLRVEPTPLLYASENTGCILLITITYTQISYHTLSFDGRVCISLYLYSSPKPVLSNWLPFPGTNSFLRQEQ